MVLLLRLDVGTERAWRRNKRLQAKNRRRGKETHRYNTTRTRTGRERLNTRSRTEGAVGAEYYTTKWKSGDWPEGQDERGRGQEEFKYGDGYVHKVRSGQSRVG